MYSNSIILTVMKESLFEDFEDASSFSMLSAVETCGFPENRLKFVVNNHLATICLSVRSETIIQGIDAFTQKESVQERFIRRQLLDHLGTFHDGGVFFLRLFHQILKTVSHFGVNCQNAAKIVNCFRNRAVQLLTDDVAGIITSTFDLESCKPLIDFVLSILGSKNLICSKSCTHSDCDILKIGVQIVRSFLLSIGNDHLESNQLRVFPVFRGSLEMFSHPQDGLVLKIAKEESMDFLCIWKYKNSNLPFKCAIFVESPTPFGNPVINEDKRLLSDETRRFGTSFDSFKMKYCTLIAKEFQKRDICVVFCQKVVDDELIGECLSRNVLVIDRLGAEEFGYLQSFLDSKMSNKWPISEFEFEKCVACIVEVSSLDVLPLGKSSKLIKLTRKDSIFQTLIVAMPNESLVSDLKMLCNCAVSSLRTVAANSFKVLKGAGEWQVLLANMLCKYFTDSAVLKDLSLEMNISTAVLKHGFVSLCSALARTGTHINPLLNRILAKEIRNQNPLVLTDYDDTDESKISSFQVYDCFSTYLSVLDMSLNAALTLVKTDRFIGANLTRRDIENAKPVR